MHAIFAFQIYTSRVINLKQEIWRLTRLSDTRPFIPRCLNKISIKYFYCIMLDTFVDQLKSVSICYYRSRSIALGSSTAVLMVFKQVTASLPSIRRWSYVRAMYIIGRITTCPFLTTGLSNVPCIPRIAD